jgi:hypothetical protein
VRNTECNPRGLALVLSAAVYVPGVASTHVGALEIAHKHPPQVVPTIDGVSREMAQPGLGGFSQIDSEEQDDEQIIGCPSHSTREAIILQPDDGVAFAIVFGDVAQCSKA